ncbi:transcriptional repressor TCF25-domain-containing protein [Lipomyces japonicus]|uniref:transcriptional repressor TCF25-domain-containing protein n=1 Tax=Lipomyces japonicus TaxID=56871 RepID=UPI0034CF77D0
MSSRAVRRAQRAQGFLSVSEDSESVIAKPTKNVSPFAALREADDDGNESSQGEEEKEVQQQGVPSSKNGLFAVLAGEDNDQDKEDQDLEQGQSGDENEHVTKVDEPKTLNQKSTKRKKHKEKLKKAKAKAAAAAAAATVSKEAGQDNDDLDEIDRALAEINLKHPETGRNNVNESKRHATERAIAQAQTDARLLSVDTRNLDPEREMRKLFGRRVFQEEREQVRRGPRGGPARPVASRRYVLVQPAEDWPPLIGASSMQMETVDSKGEITYFKFTHSREYMDVQKQFLVFLRAGDPDLLIELLQHNLYHVSLLLQVSEIFTHQGEHTKAARSVECALFTFNKAFHSLFNIASGRVRLPFKYYENRGFYLSVYRHVRNLERKGTWLTAFEFLKLLLEVSAEEDPYQILLMIDTYALHSGNEKFLIELSKSVMFKSRIDISPNIAFSLALAYAKTKQHELAKTALVNAASKFPWVFNALLFALALDVPSSIMSFNEPPSTYQHLLSELYLNRSSTHWSSPEAKSLLTYAAFELEKILPSPPANVLDSKRKVTRDLARHVLLADIKPALALLPRDAVDEEIWTDDILPPQDNVSPYQTNTRRQATVATQYAEDGQQVDEQSILQAMWNSFRNWRRAGRNQDIEHDHDAGSDVENHAYGDLVGEEEPVAHSAAMARAIAEGVAVGTVDGDDDDDEQFDDAVSEFEYNPYEGIVSDDDLALNYALRESLARVISGVDDYIDEDYGDHDDDRVASPGHDAGEANFEHSPYEVIAGDDLALNHALQQSLARVISEANGEGEQNGDDYDYGYGPDSDDDDGYRDDYAEGYYVPDSDDDD